MTLPSVTLAANPHSAARDSSGIRSRLTSVSRADLVWGGGGSAAMAPPSRTRVDDSEGTGAARRSNGREVSPGTVALDKQRTPPGALHADRHTSTATPLR